jgi:16S rRNA (cytosine1402-N4)-methyltransferase
LGFGEKRVADEPVHVSVLYEAVLSGLHLGPAGRYVDGTVGAGGHAEGILKGAPQGRLLGLDRDPGALALCRERLRPYGDRVILVHSNFADIERVVGQLEFGPVDGIVLDLGLSSMQLADPARGFSFQRDGPLDMRFDPESHQGSAAAVVNDSTVDELADWIYRYGEEPASRAIARAIVAARPVRTTAQLAEVVAGAVRRNKRSRSSQIHPATRTFQAIRIVVNRELESLEQGLEGAVNVLRPGGRLAVIAFHSLEDRIVKQFFALESRDCICPPETLVCACGHRARLARVHNKPIRPAKEEMDRNPRSRSARLRIATKVQA